MNFLKSSINTQIVRNYAFKSDLKIKWVRPEKIPCFKPEKSGDLAKLPPLAKGELALDFVDSREIQTADDTVKKIFSLDYQPRYKTSDKYRTDMVREVQRHGQDFGSMESKLAKMTATIRRYQEHMEEYPRDTRIKVDLKELIDKRKKFLKYLRRWDYKRFEWVLEKLDLQYKPPPAKFHWITRKESLVKLTDIHCETVKQERIEQYKQQLEDKQLEFLERKIENLKFIRKEQLECSIEPTVTEQDIEGVRSKLEFLKECRVPAKKETDED